MLLLVPLYRLVERERENTVSIKTTRCSLILTKRVEREEDDRLGTGEGRGMMDWRGGWRDGYPHFNKRSSHGWWYGKQMLYNANRITRMMIAAAYIRLISYTEKSNQIPYVVQ